ncbi:hypothetical protein AVEN_53375-1 [Araneus ventricosus]|uniref:Uncharacterized protein n=1 Tax=Araneus ventricosus TaxID=182803 RepID=A0A4Y2AAS8_ARAVE|nr:hypothetical protein AVEN_53375-1 [Araneus ventricosus]
MIWTIISLVVYTDLYAPHGRTFTVVRYRGEILDPYTRSYTGAVGEKFILMDGISRPHRARLLEESFEVQGLELMNWPAQFPDLTPIEHVSDYLGGQVLASITFLRSLNELERTFQWRREDEWLPGQNAIFSPPPSPFIISGLICVNGTEDMVFFRPSTSLTLKSYAKSKVWSPWPADPGA